MGQGLFLPGKRFIQVAEPGMDVGVKMRRDVAAARVVVHFGHQRLGAIALAGLRAEGSQ